MRTERHKFIEPNPQGREIVVKKSDNKGVKYLKMTMARKTHKTNEFFSGYSFKCFSDEECKKKYCCKTRKKYEKLSGVQEKLLAPLVTPLSTINIMNLQLLDIQSSLPVIVQAKHMYMTLSPRRTPPINQEAPVRSSKKRAFNGTILASSDFRFPVKIYQSETPASGGFSMTLIHHKEIGKFGMINVDYSKTQTSTPSAINDCIQFLAGTKSSNQIFLTKDTFGRRPPSRISQIEVKMIPGRIKGYGFTRMEARVKKSEGTTEVLEGEGEARIEEKEKGKDELGADDNEEGVQKERLDMGREKVRTGKEEVKNACQEVKKIKFEEEEGKTGEEEVEAKIEKVEAKTKEEKSDVNLKGLKRKGLFEKGEKSRAAKKVVWDTRGSEEAGNQDPVFMEEIHDLADKITLKDVDAMLTSLQFTDPELDKKLCVIQALKLRMSHKTQK